MRGQVFVEQFALLRFADVYGHARSQMRDQDPDTGMNISYDQPRSHRADNRLLEEEDVGILGCPGLQMVRPLIHKMPPEMGQAQQCRSIASAFGLVCWWFVFVFWFVVLGGFLLLVF